MTSFADFQAYYLRKIWREGDADLTNDLPKLVREAESRIKRDLRDWTLATTANLELTSGNVFTLPGDFRELISGSVNGHPLRSSIPATQLHRNKYDVEGPLIGDSYSIMGRTLMVRGEASAIIPGNLSITYFMDLVPYELEPANPFYDLHQDFYIAALNVFAYDYIREFELKAMNEEAYNTLLDSMIRNSNYARFPSGQLVMPTPRRVV